MIGADSRRRLFLFTRREQNLRYATFHALPDYFAVSTARRIAMKTSFDEAMSEIRKGIKAYQSMQKSLERDHFGKIAMFHDGKLVSTYNDHGDAYDIGCEKFGLGHFSLKQIGEKPASMGGATLYIQPMSMS